LAYDDDPLINPDDFLGESTTDAGGRFAIAFDRSLFQRFWEFFEGEPDIYLILQGRTGNEILQTKIHRTGHEIEYHIRLAQHTPDPNAKDIYAANANRLVNMLGEVGSLIGIEGALNLDVLANPGLPTDVRAQLEGFGRGADDRLSNFNQFSAVLNGVVNQVLEERGLRRIGYDGPQVPRLPRRERYDQVITWPRKEAFRWG